VDGDGAILKSGEVDKIAIANPKLAPYGAAAVEVIRKLGLSDALSSKIVEGASIGQAFQITPARRLAEAGFPEGLDSVLVMLDAQDTYQRFVDQPMQIYWGAYIGTPDEVLIAGPLSEVAETIRSRRAELREQHGWIMDSYLLRKLGP
jgi:precorrin-6A synthase (deacetylating)